MQQIVRVFWDTQLATFLWHIAARAHLERQTHNRVYQRVSRIWAGAAALPGNNATRGNKSIDIELTTTRRPTGQLPNSSRRQRQKPDVDCAACVGYAGCVCANSELGFILATSCCLLRFVLLYQVGFIRPNLSQLL